MVHAEMGKPVGICAVLPVGPASGALLHFDFFGQPHSAPIHLECNSCTYFFSPGWIRGRRVPGPDREDHLRSFYAKSWRR